MSLGPTSSAVFFNSTISANCCRNQGSILVNSWTVSVLQPRSSASKTAHIRRSVGTTSCFLSAASSNSSSLLIGVNSRPVRPSSSDRMPFRNASLNVRPMAIASPTDFICVVSVGSASGNFSKFHRGILTTT